MSSPKQIQEILFEKMKLPVITKTPKGQASTSESVLSDLSKDYELPKIILDYRSLAKLCSTYTDKLPKQVNIKTGRIHGSFHQAVTSTGRLSSSNPNLQNIPIRTEEGKKVREAFRAPPDKVLIAADYSQIELRIMAHISKDDTLINAFKEEQDIHAATAAEVFETGLSNVSFEQRRAAKAINFGLIYGMSSFGLAKQLDITRNEAQDYIDIYFSRYPKIKQYMENIRKKAAKNGYVETIFGRRLYINNINNLMLSSTYKKNEYFNSTLMSYDRRILDLVNNYSGPDEEVCSNIKENFNNTFYVDGDNFSFTGTQTPSLHNLFTDSCVLVNIDLKHRVLIKKNKLGSFNLFSCYLTNKNYCPYEEN